MKIRALKAFTIRDIETGNLTSIAYGGIAEVSDTVGSSLISDGLAEAYTLVNPTGSVNISSNGTVDVAEYATAVVNVPGVTPTGAIEITSNGTVDVTNYATAEVNVDYTTVNFNLSESINKTTKALSQARRKLAATTLSPAGGSNPQSGHALFGGGVGSGDSAVVDAYDINLERTTAPTLSQARYGLAATTVGDYALFGGGYNGLDSAVVDAYDTNLERTTATTLSEGRDFLAATTVGDYALFGGGVGSGNFALVEAYDTDLEKTTPLAFSVSRSGLAATTVAPAGGPGYALFGGGYTFGGASSYPSSWVYACDSSLTIITSLSLSEARGSLAATTVAHAGGSGYALFGGGKGGGDVYYELIDVYDSSLTRTTPTALSQARYHLAATTLAITEDSVYALFGGGFYDADNSSSVVDVYDSSLTRIAPTALSAARGFLAATTLATTGGSGYALFGGGGGVDSYSSVVDVYGPQDYKVQVFPGTKYSFNGSEELVSDAWQEINISGSLIGYIKIKSAQIN